MPRSSAPSPRTVARPGRSGRPGSTARFSRSSAQRPQSRPLPPRFTPRSTTKGKGKGKSKGASSGLTGMLGALPFGKSKAKPASSGRGKKGAGLALLTAAAGLAVSNRDKLGGLVNRRKQEPEPIAPPTENSAHTTP